MAIEIGGKTININDLEEYFCYDKKGNYVEWPNWLDKLLDNVLNEHLNDPQVTLVYDSYEAFENDFTSIGPGGSLPDARKVFHSKCPSGVTITMTGDYIEDFGSAAQGAIRQFGVSEDMFDADGRVDGYVWHHVENPCLKMEDNSICVMELLTRESHSHPHKGAVSQYRAKFSKGYS